ncbi:UDP-N-acetylglucosamine--N-acetylmuramyl-(pentapeptide) pyrophosphoryl-undecaprenol N-acetylglucosamine transferase [Candidatus Microgenomates bacterium]|nr:UDP-N-acetylglucosamine--N-acetylmuramyl-(pentapeptide) pyrophosphoryl-undecaprenol N-acetylglucosamine transferase [Candidatus Microgenomates bacterium]
MRIVLSGGGSGGHLTPLLTVASALKQLAPQAELVYIGDRRPLTERLMAHQGFSTRYILAGKWRRYRGQNWWQRLFDIGTWLLNLRDLLKLVLGFFQSLAILIHRRPQVVFVKGGYVGLPVGMAAWLLGIPLIIHESDAIPGLTNRLLAHLAKTVAVSWPTRYFAMWQHKHLVFTGNPVRSEIVTGDPVAARRLWKLETKVPTLLVMGGSYGSQIINRQIISQLPRLLKRWQVIHISGAVDLDRVKQLFDRLGLTAQQRQRYHLVDFLNEQLAAAYAVADIIVARAGMNTISELALLGKPAILIPHRVSPGGHQQRNAELLESHQAALILAEGQLGRLAEMVDQLRAAIPQQQLLRKGWTKLAKPEAAQLVAQEIIKLI